MLEKYKPYVISLLFTFAIALFSNYLVGDSTMLYNTIVKPTFAPPASVFGIVWPILYALMAIAAGLIYGEECHSDTCQSSKKHSLRLYVIQLLFNALWPILFFNLELFALSFVWIIILWILILKMTIDFYKINKVAGYLVLPYLLWVTFAAYLNFMIATLN